jgi:hypothetical protein
MRFELIVNMPVRGKADEPPALIHRMVVDHKSDSLEEFVAEISYTNLIIVEEFFPDKFYSWRNATSNGEIAINTDLIGKVREWTVK